MEFLQKVYRLFTSTTGLVADPRLLVTTAAHSGEVGHHGPIAAAAPAGSVAAGACPCPCLDLLLATSELRSVGRAFLGFGIVNLVTFGFAKRTLAATGSYPCPYLHQLDNDPLDRPCPCSSFVRRPSRGGLGNHYCQIITFHPCACSMGQSASSFADLAGVAYLLPGCVEQYPIDFVSRISTISKFNKSWFENEV